LEGYGKNATNKKWIDAMKEELKMIERKSNTSACGQTPT